MSFLMSARSAATTCNASSAAVQSPCSAVNAVWIAVSDDGAGIALEEHERIFAPFYRGQTTQRFPEGMGLGLTIARDLIVAHGGQLTIHSALGQGSRFTICLPCPA